MPSLKEVIVKGVSDAFSPASLVTAGLSFLGGERRNQQAANSTAAANAFSAQQYASRWQTTVKDMEAAGLNPMLAYQQGVGNQPTGQAAQYQDTISPAVASFQAQNLQESQQEANYGSAAQSRANVKLMNETVNKTKQEVENLQSTNEQTRAVIKNLAQQYENLRDEGNNIKATNQQIVATTRKILKEIPKIDAETLRQAAETMLTNKETQLRGFDVSAAEAAGNLGRNMGQVKPVLDILMEILKPRGGGITINRGR